MKLKILTIAVLVFLSGSLLAQTPQLKQITSKEAVKMLNKNIVVLDVRTADEFNQGHIKGAINIDIKQANAFDKISKLNPEATYLVHCRTSHRSTNAVDYMLTKGFKKIYQMIDGYSGWSQNNFPVTK
jgi:rhodanese-related sulfurtransferase